MGCILVLLSLISARLAIIFTWLFTERMTLAFSSGWYGIIGFFFLPWTTLAYVWTYEVLNGAPSAFGWILVAFAFLVDISSYGGGAREQRRRGNAY